MSNLSNDVKLFSTLFVTLSIFIALGIYYLVIANTYGGEFLGTLIDANVNIVTSCSSSKSGTSCSTKYYVDEIFRKDNSTNTCTVERLTPYYFKGSANNIVNNIELYTTRTIWTSTYNAGTCYDITIRNYYNAIGGTFIGFAGIILLLPLLFIFKDILMNVYLQIKHSCDHLLFTNNINVNDVNDVNNVNNVNNVNHMDNQNVIKV